MDFCCLQLQTILEEKKGDLYPARIIQILNTVYVNVPLCFILFISQYLPSSAFLFFFFNNSGPCSSPFSSFGTYNKELNKVSLDQVLPQKTIWIIHLQYFIHVLSLAHLKTSISWLIFLLYLLIFSYSHIYASLLTTNVLFRFREYM